ncbi:MAG: hypothetical protein NC344_11440 [Bacteroidales bacterium]|nr:hypothetical protein [Bacteroidales bacterium]MCM1148419.1 hypothetical protein [Bacteroidales bacterium]MCM1207273.1 hypothetical protein [Bacillota bacterium]MCM1511496.1 hypothetical protein [Clostridium sp.]
MKRILFVLLFTTVCLQIQAALDIDRIFATYGHSKGCKMVEMHDTKLRGHQLRTYKSLVYKTIGAEVDKALAKDKRNAKKIREVVDNGTVISGYYQMASADGKTNRYILFSKGPKGSGTLIYIEGALKPEDIMSMCYGKGR